jgi:hypothetical protein
MPLGLRRTAPVASGLAVVVLLGSLLASCGGSGHHLVRAATLPAHTVPPTMGEIRFQQEPSLEAQFEKAGTNALVASGVVYSVRRGDEVLGSVQLAPFKPELIGSDKDIDDVRRGVVSGIGNGRFRPQRVGGDVVLAQRGSRTTLYLWFAPDTSFFELMVAGREFQDAETVFGSLLAFQRGDATTTVVPAIVDQIDPRKGGVD